MSDTRPATNSPFGLPVPPPPLNGGGASDPALLAEEGYALRAAWEKEFVERVMILSEWLLAIARSRLHSEEDAEEAVQDVLKKAAKANIVAKCGSDDGRIRAYLLKAIGNRVNDQFRDRGRKNTLVRALTAWRRSRKNDAVPPLQDVLSREILETIEAALRELSWNHQEVFRKVRMQGYKYAEAAESLGMEVDMLRAILAKANGHVRQRLTAAGLAPNDGGRTKEDAP